MTKNSKKTSTLLTQKNPPVQKLKEKTAALGTSVKKKVNTDNVIDFSVDVGIVAFDVLLSGRVLLVCQLWCVVCWLVVGWLPFV